MSKFHINTDGNPGKCRAESNGCPFSSDEDHYSTREEAASAYESSMSSKNVSTHKTAVNTPNAKTDQNPNNPTVSAKDHYELRVSRAQEIAAEAGMTEETWDPKQWDGFSRDDVVFTEPNNLYQAGVERLKWKVQAETTKPTGNFKDGTHPIRLFPKGSEVSVYDGGLLVARGKYSTKVNDAGETVAVVDNGRGEVVELQGNDRVKAFGAPSIRKPDKVWKEMNSKAERLSAQRQLFDKKADEIKKTAEREIYESYNMI